MCMLSHLRLFQACFSANSLIQSEFVHYKYRGKGFFGMPVSVVSGSLVSAWRACFGGERRRRAPRRAFGRDVRSREVRRAARDGKRQNLGGCGTIWIEEVDGGEVKMGLAIWMSTYSKLIRETSLLTDISIRERRGRHIS